ncbi:carboxymuconolactone decarboxylase family protein [Salidesulfovibrio brasiliensis]|uniref:carboxymuconolactone decarboxylase family protein n=1 Tax=Salidesulfovibrio brasiliensis TaxID=221711 RepID=UPI0006D1254B|nr:hypothetical protein [Salidesulfovibrio brasiliensis]
MFKISYVPVDNAEGAIADAYSQFPEAFGIPAPLQLMSASPGMFKCQMALIDYFSREAGFDFAIPAAIRYMAACHFKADACVEFNAKLLAAAGLGDDELETLSSDPDNGPFEERENRLIAFVKKVVEGRDVSEEEVETLRSLGWTDANIYDACSQGTFMAGAGLMMNAFSK